MSSKRKIKDKGIVSAAVPRENAASPCIICNRTTDDELIYEKIYTLGDISCHYFCVLLSSCVIQRGDEEEGLFGFLYADIVAEAQRGKKCKCSFCGKSGATLGCSVSRCRKQFHLPCGREHNAVSIYHGTYKSFCENHYTKQVLPPNIQVNAKARQAVWEKQQKQQDRQRRSLNKNQDIDSSETVEGESSDGCVCVICYTGVLGFPSPRSFWPPCCGRDAWFHRECLQRMCLSAGIHYLKCPLCNDKEEFYRAVVSQGYYVPDRDAAWELEQNAYAGIYERPESCAALACTCPMGRDHDADDGAWCLKLCLLCGSSGVHAGCLPSSDAVRYICDLCSNVHIPDMNLLENKLRAVSVSAPTSTGNSGARRRRGPRVRSRMSLRRTKPTNKINNTSRSSSSSSSLSASFSTSQQQASSDTAASRLELNLKTPRPMPVDQHASQTTGLSLETVAYSPMKLLDEKVRSQMLHMDTQATNKLVDQLRDRFRKPAPLSVKKIIVQRMLDEFLADRQATIDDIRELLSPTKPKTSLKHDPLEVTEIQEQTEIQTTTRDIPTDAEEKEAKLVDVDESSTSTFELPPEFIADYTSDNSLTTLDTPKKLKTVDIEKNSSIEISENNEAVHINVYKLNVDDNTEILTDLINTPNKNVCVLKFSPNHEDLQKKHMDIDVETFKNNYLAEVEKKIDQNKTELKKHAKVKERGKENSKNNRKNKKALKRKHPNDKAKVPNKKRKLDKKSKNKCKVKIKLKHPNQQKKQLKNKSNKKKKKLEKKIKLTFKIKKEINHEPNEVCLKYDLSPKRLKQTVINFSPENNKNDKLIVKPETNVSPMKRKYIKKEVVHDTLKQTSLDNFFHFLPSRPTNE